MTNDYDNHALVVDGGAAGLYAGGRRQLTFPTVTVRHGVVRYLTPGFAAALDDGTTVRARRVLGSYVAADATGLTAVPGVWVAGNVADLTARRDPFSAESEARVAEQVAGTRRHGLSRAVTS